MPAPSATDLLKQLIACRSITPAGGGSLELVASVLEEAGFRTQRLPKGEVDNLLVYDRMPIRLLFAGHTDVVPPGDLSLWNSDPFTAVEADGYLYGRGAADMKSGVAAMTVAMARAATAGKANGVGLFLTTDEEGPAIDGTRHFVDWWRAQKHAMVDACIVGEPSCEEVFGDSIKTGRRGSLTGRIRINGTQTHVAYPQQGDNPSHRLIAALAQLGAAWADNDARLARGEMVTTYQLTDLQSGVGADNVTPPHASAVFNFRYTNDAGGGGNDAATYLQEQVAAVFDEHARGLWQCEWEHGAEPFAMPADGAFVQQFAHIVSAHTGQTPALNTRGGTSDGRFLQHICRELLEFGVHNATIHAVNERVLLASVEQLAEIYEQAIYLQCK